MEYLAQRRGVRIGWESMRLLARDVDAISVQPLGDPTFLASAANVGGKLGIGDRTAIMRSLFAGVLPDQLLARPDKATFGPAFIGAATLEFARSWQGEGVDHRLVDPDILKASWGPERFDFRGALILQAAWLHQQRS
jgi:asparagine synthase (glutamine-hydrolysing)